MTTEAQKIQLRTGLPFIDSVSSAARVSMGVDVINNLLNPLGNAISTNSPQEHLYLLNPADQRSYTAALFNMIVGNAGIYLRASIRVPFGDESWIRAYTDMLSSDFDQTPLKGSIDSLGYRAQAHKDKITPVYAVVDQSKRLREYVGEQGEMLLLYKKIAGSSLFESTDVYHFITYYVKSYGAEWMLKDNNPEDPSLLKQGETFEKAVLKMSMIPKPNPSEILVGGRVDEKTWSNITQTWLSKVEF